MAHMSCTFYNKMPPNFVLLVRPSVSVIILFITISPSNTKLYQISSPKTLPTYGFFLATIPSKRIKSLAKKKKKSPPDLILMIKFAPTKIAFDFGASNLQGDVQRWAEVF